MPFEKGKATPGAGRRKGVPNKSTEKIKEAFSKLLERNTKNIDGWLARVAEKDPAKALEIMTKFAPFFIAKKTASEIEITGNPINVILPKKED